MVGGTASSVSPTSLYLSSAKKASITRPTVANARVKYVISGPKITALKLPRRHAYIDKLINSSMQIPSRGTTRHTPTDDARPTAHTSLVVS